jgi:hypothetical protein
MCLRSLRYPGWYSQNYTFKVLQQKEHFTINFNLDYSVYIYIHKNTLHLNISVWIGAPYFFLKAGVS